MLIWLISIAPKMWKLSHIWSYPLQLYNYLLFYHAFFDKQWQQYIKKHQKKGIQNTWDVYESATVQKTRQAEPKKKFPPLVTT